ncbi:laccase-like [Dendronephthya gigantea]|uniref:laccase-like n=1 Tax=Dendronephthya gigantea TaxID=151771 RepID=UPI001069DAE2|nr:laccase-like [Dendronephthya gigantea]
MQYILALAAALFVMSTVQGLSTNDSPVCFDPYSVPYIPCSDETDFEPSVCDCGYEVEGCYVRLEITGGNSKFKINNGRFGPTIIVKHYGILVVDVINNIDEVTSIHWHGMHQRNVPWMDGVANITQYPIHKGGKFRYIFRAHPSGTHWYHSHVGYQRDHGIVGALIVREKEEILHELSNYPPLPEGESIQDFPDKYTLSVTEHLQSGKGGVCMLDKSRSPQLNKKISAFLINGVVLRGSVDEGIEEVRF